jgi:3-methyladenine DNA glycosylase AlkD
MMARRRSSAVEKALGEYLRKFGLKSGAVYKIAAKHKIAPSSLYRAIKQNT